MRASKVVTDAIKRIMVAMKEGQFSRAELEGIIGICDALKRLTQKTLDKGPIVDEPPREDDESQ